MFMVMNVNQLHVTFIVICIITSVLIIAENKFSSPAFACQTNAIGCQKQGGPGSSFLSPPEVSGCHVFPPVGACAQDSTPPGMGQGPK